MSQMFAIFMLQCPSAALPGSRTMGLPESLQGPVHTTPHHIRRLLSCIRTSQQPEGGPPQLPDNLLSCIRTSQQAEGGPPQLPENQLHSLLLGLYMQPYS